MKRALLAGIAAVAIAGTAFAATTKLITHEMSVQLPEGGMAHIYYTGNTRPSVVLRSGPPMLPAAAWFLAPDPFAQIERINAQMDRMWASLDREMAGAMAANKAAFNAAADRNVPLSVSTKNLPPGTSFSYISTFSSSNGCAQTVRITSEGSAKPQVVRQTSGDCSAVEHGNGPMQAKVLTSPSSDVFKIHATGNTRTTVPRQGI
jgi:hypothetical protein